MCLIIKTTAAPQERITEKRAVPLPLNAVINRWRYKWPTSTCRQIGTCSHTFTQSKTAHWMLHCRSSSTVLHFLWSNYRSEVTQQSHPMTIFNRTSPTHFSPSSKHFPHSFIHRSSHPFCSAVISHFVSSNSYWLCSQRLCSLSLSQMCLPITGLCPFYIYHPILGSPIW